MARIGVKIPNFDMANYTNNEAKLKNYVEWVRDHFISKLDGSATGNDFKVSDLFEWTGISSQKGLAFIVEMRDGSGNPTGPQYMIVSPYRAASSGRSQGIFAANNGTTWAQYIEGIDDVATGGTDYGLHIFYFPKGGRKRVRVTASGTTGAGGIGNEVRDGSGNKRGIIRVIHSATDWEIEMTQGGKFVATDVLTDQTTAGTFTVTAETWRDHADVGWSDHQALALPADYTVTNTNPYSDIAGFLPVDDGAAGSSGFRRMRGRVFEEQADSAPSTVWCVFDNDIGCMGAYSTESLLSYIRQIYLAGPIVINRDGSTDWVDLVFGIELTNSQGGFGVPDSSYIEGVYREHAGGGGIATFSYRDHDDFTYLNALDANGENPESFIHIYNSNEAKGWINPNVARVQGPYNRYPFQITNRDDGGGNDNTCIKIHISSMFPWDANMSYIQDYTSPSEFPPPEYL